MTASFQRPSVEDAPIRQHARPYGRILAQQHWCKLIGSDYYGRPSSSSNSVSSWLTKICQQWGAGPLILSWINEICSDDTEKRALLVAVANDFAYVVQAIVSPDSSSDRMASKIMLTRETTCIKGT